MSDLEGPLTVAAVTNITFAFMSFMPKPAELVQGEPDPNFRINEASAAVATIGMGIALSFMAKSGLPLLASLVGTAILIAGYEYLAHTTDARIARTRNDERKRYAEQVRI